MENRKIVLSAGENKKICIFMRADSKNAQLKKKFRPQNFIVQPIVSVNGQQTEKIYIKHGFLGKGGFANCYVTQCLGNKKLMATKVIKKCQLRSNRTKMRLMNEIKIHKTFRHENIVEFYHYFQDYQNVYLMLQLCQNQSLSELLKIRQYLTTPEIQSILYGICNGVKYMHSKKYIHRDLKLANIFLDEKFVVKIGDFGLTSQLQFSKENKRTLCGTPNYIAPEILQGTGYTFSVDIWAIGIIIYSLYYGYPPFQSEETHQIYSKIKQNSYTFPKDSEVPYEAICLIKRILVNDPQKRPTIDEIQNSPFMKLGKGIPLELPEVCDERPPQKTDFINIPFLKIQEPTKDTFQKKTQKRQETTLSFYEEERLKKINNFIKDQPQPIKENGPEVYVIDVDELGEGNYIFCTNLHLIGVYEKDKMICFKALDSKEDELNEIKLSHNLFGEVTKVPFNGHKYRMAINCKHKKIYSKQNMVQEQSKKNYYASKIHRYKDMTMIRLSNKSIQIAYDSRDGFLYETKSQKLYYFQNIEMIRYPNHIVEIEKENIMKTVKNYMQMAEKTTTVPNITTNIPTVHTNEHIKLTINKMKCIYGIINQYKSKRTKHTKFRNSQ